MRWAAPLAVLALAALLRVVALDTVPAGLHGDEAVTGLDGRRARAEGWLGPYLYPSALGQPAGPVYVTAAVFALGGESTFTLRLSMALVGVATVGMTWLAARALFGPAVALLAAALLAVQPWHLHLSRTAFMLNAWPCVAMAALWLIFRARAAPHWARWLGAGAVVGLGIYTYNAYVLTVPVLAVPFLADWFAPPPGRTRRDALRAALLAGGAALAVALPMLEYARTHEEYFWHHEEVGLLHDPAWQAADTGARARRLAARAAEWGGGLVLGGRPDDGDGLGERGFPLLDPATSLAALAGVVMALRRWREPAHAVLLAALLLLPFGALLTIGDGLYRRSFALAPVAAILAALPLAALWQAARRRGRRPARIATLALGGFVLLVGARTAYAYFGPLQATEQMAYVFPVEVDAAARAVAALPPETIVYWYSERWPATYETRQWYAPDAEVVERAPEFGAAPADDGTPSLVAASDRPSAFVLLGRYRALAPALAARHPGAEIREERRDGRTLFTLVRVPALD